MVEKDEIKTIIFTHPACACGDIVEMVKGISHDYTFFKVC